MRLPFSFVYEGRRHILATGQPVPMIYFCYVWAENAVRDYLLVLLAARPAVSGSLAATLRDPVFKAILRKEIVADAAALTGAGSDLTLSMDRALAALAPAALREIVVDCLRRSVASALDARRGIEPGLKAWLDCLLVPALVSEYLRRLDVRGLATEVVQ
jgi:hypothetical protein